MHCMDLMHKVSYSLWADRKYRIQPVNFDLFPFFFGLYSFDGLPVRVLFSHAHVGWYLLEFSTSACISSTQPLYWKMKENNNHALKLDCWRCPSCKYDTLCKKDEFIGRWRFANMLSCQGTKWVQNKNRNTMYIMCKGSSVCSDIGSDDTSV